MAAAAAAAAAILGLAQSPLFVQSIRDTVLKCEALVNRNLQTVETMAVWKEECLFMTKKIKEREFNQVPKNTHKKVLAVKRV